MGQLSLENVGQQAPTPSLQAWRVGHMWAPRSCLLQGRHLSQKQAWTLRPPAPVNAPCSRRSLCWRTELSQERGQFQTKPATWRRDQCLRKPPSSRRPQFLRCSWPQAGPWPQCGPRDWEHSASAECLSSPGGQHGTGPEKEPKSSGGPLSQPGGLLPITLQVRGAPHFPVLPASLEASPSSCHFWRPQSGLCSESQVLPCGGPGSHGPY